MFDLKKYRAVIFHDIEGWCKIWRKIHFWFGKWHEEFGKFSPEQLKISKLELWWDPLIQSRKSVSLNITEELCVMEMKNDANLKRNWLAVSKLTWKIWLILTRPLESLKIGTLMGSFNPKQNKAWAWNFQGSYVSWQ